MTITSVGYDGTVNETQWASLVPRVGIAHYGISGTDDWRVSALTTMDRGINISVGSGWGHGVLDTSDATVSLQGGLVSSGDRWDMVVARRNWSGIGGATTFVIIAGSAAKALPARNTTPGTLDDQPIALIRFTAGQTAVQEIVPLRCWARNGGMVAKDVLALTFLKELGAQVTINGAMWLCVPDVNGNPSWISSSPMGTTSLFGVGGALSGNPALVPGFLIQAGSAILTTDQVGYARLTFPQSFPGGLLTVFLMNGDNSATAGATFYTVEGNNAFWGISGTGGPADVVYSVWRSQNGAGPILAPNLQHRVDFIAIGW
ncbi:MAG TPA: hypothetical protein DCR15_14035 [Arthrobacter bacterium]|nr:hypothetical protein [Arthrobacter sp.]